MQCNLELSLVGDHFCQKCGFRSLLVVENECTGTKDDCKYRGEKIDQIPCPSCHGGVKIKVFECIVYIQCTIAKKVDENTVCCFECGDYSVS